MPDLSHGSGMQKASEPLGRVLARIEEIRAAQRQREGNSSEQSPAQNSQAGNQQVLRELRTAKVPDLYSEAVWGMVRSPAVKDWVVGVDARTQRLSERGPTNYNLLGHGMLIMGPTGTGKSSAAALCARDTVAAGRTIAWRYVPDLLDTMTAGAKERTPEIRRLSYVDVLFLDDFGVREIADWEVGYLDQIMEARYRNRKPVVVTTNLTPRDLMADQRLERMVDRWRERTASQMVILPGESMRNVGKPQYATP